MQGQVREATRAVRGWTREHLANVRAFPIVVAFSAALFLAVSGAFELYRFELTRRIVFCIVAMAACTAFGMAFDAKFPLAPWRARPAMRAAIRWAILLLPYTLIAGSLSLWFYGLNGRSLASLPYAVRDIAIATAALAAIRLLEPAPAAADQAELANNATLHSKLPPRFRTATILAVEAQDHYLHVHTDIGATLIKMRFADALTLLARLDGARTHRSWWVAKNAVSDIKRGAGRANITLSNGVTASVSRAYAKDLRASGWY